MTLGPGRFSGQVLASTGTAGQRGMPGRTVAGIGGVGFSPLHLAPDLWLDASDASTITASSGSVSQWTDKSPNAWAFVQATGANQPVTGTRTQNGLNVIDFTPNQFLSGGDILDLGSSSFSAFAVVKTDGTSGNGALFGKTFNTATNGLYGPLRDSGNLLSTYYVTGNPGQLSTSASTSNPLMLSIVLYRAGSAASQVVRLSGGVNSVSRNSFTDLTTTSLNTSADWQIGRYGNSTTVDLNGWIAEIVFLLRTATSDEVQSIETYLRAKWAI
jgi:hypothetical protein